MKVGFEFESKGIRLICALQLFAALAICINHLSFALLKGVHFSHFWEGQPTLLGIAFLAFSAGFLTHAHQLSRQRDCGRVEFIVRRFLRIAIPTYIAVVIDLNFISWPLVGGGVSWWPLLSVATLTQTWSYNVFGEASLPLPLGQSNLVWVGSCLFGLFLIHSLTFRLWERMSAAGAVVVFCIAAGWCFCYFATIDAYKVDVAGWSLRKYGELLLPYQFLNWLLLYNPMAEIGHYLAGVAIAQWLAATKMKPPRGQAMVIAASCVILIFGSSTAFPIYLGLNCAIVLLIVMLAKGGASGGMSIRFADTVTPIAYEVVIFHIMIYALFPLSVDVSGGGTELLIAVTRAVGVNLLMIAMLAAFTRLLTFPLQGVCERALGMKPASDHHL